MKVLYDEVSIKIWTDGYSPIVFVRLLSIPKESREFNEIRKANIKSIKAMFSLYREVYSILDLSDCDSGRAENLIKYFIQHLSEQAQAGLQYLAIVKPRNYFSELLLEESFAAHQSLKAGVFNSFYDALHFLNEMRIAEGIKI